MRTSPSRRKSRSFPSVIPSSHSAVPSGNHFSLTAPRDFSELYGRPELTATRVCCPARLSLRAEVVLGFGVRHHFRHHVLMIRHHVLMIFGEVALGGQLGVEWGNVAGKIFRVTVFALLVTAKALLLRNSLG